MSKTTGPYQNAVATACKKRPAKTMFSREAKL